MKRVAVCLTSLVVMVAARAELPLINDPANDPAWRALFTHLAETHRRQSAFEERRYFAFRKTPVMLTGEMRMDPARGLSLHYAAPEARTMIVDAKGILLRDARGRERAAPSDRRADAATHALVDVLRFDVAALQKSFELRGQRAGDAWTLSFVPRDRALAAATGTVLVTGEHERPQKIEMIQSANQRVEILIGETHDDVVFTAEELARFFR
jgi:hypothetical protein